MGQPYLGGGAAGGTGSEGDVGDASVVGAACGGVAKGGVGDVLDVGVGDAGSVVADALVVSACSVCEGAARVGTAGVALVMTTVWLLWVMVLFVHGLSWAWALATPGGGLGEHLWLVGLPALVVLAASGVWAGPRQSWRGVLTVGVVLVTALSMSVMSAVSGGSPGYAGSEVGVGGVGVGGVISDATAEGGAGAGSADAVGLGCAFVVSGVGGVCVTDGDVGIGGAPVIDVVGDADGGGVAGDVLEVGAGGGVLMVRVCRVRVLDVGVSPRPSWRRLPLVLLLVGVVDVMVSLMLLVLPRVVAGDAPGDADAAGGDAIKKKCFSNALGYTLVVLEVL